MYISRRKLGIALIAAQGTVFIGSFCAWVIGGVVFDDWRMGAVVASCMALAGLATTAWTYFMNDMLGLMLGGLITHSTVPIGVLAWAYLPGRTWAVVALVVWLTAAGYSTLYLRRRMRRITLWELLVHAISNTSDALNSRDGKLFVYGSRIVTGVTLLFFALAIAGASGPVLLYVAGLMGIGLLAQNILLHRVQSGRQRLF